MKKGEEHEKRENFGRCWDTPTCWRIRRPTEMYPNDFPLNWAVSQISGCKTPPTGLPIMTEKKGLPEYAEEGEASFTVIGTAKDTVCLLSALWTKRTCIVMPYVKNNRGTAMRKKERLTDYKDNCETQHVKGTTPDYTI